MKKLTKGIVIGSFTALGAAVAMGATSYSMTHSLINIAFDRKLRVTPSIKTKQLFSGCKEMEKIEMLCNENACHLEKGDCRRVEIRGNDGIRLVGHLHLSPHPKRTILAMHGWRTTWARDFGAVSAFWHKNNCNVLYAEQRGHGDSEGSFISFGIAERYDCLNWIKWLNSTEDIKDHPMYLCGVSMGAATVLMTTGFDLPENVRGVIADCGFTSPHNVFKHVVNKNLHFPYSNFTVKDVDRVCKKRMKLCPSSYSTTEALKKCKIPVLFVHGTSDRFVPIQMTYENYTACSAPKRMFIVPGAEHGMCYFTDKDGYEKEMLRFWNDCESKYDTDEKGVYTTKKGLSQIKI